MGEVFRLELWQPKQPKYRSRFTPREVMIIRGLFDAGYQARVIARWLGRTSDLDAHHVWRIARGKVWTRVKGQSADPRRPKLRLVQGGVDG